MLTMRPSFVDRNRDARASGVTREIINTADGQQLRVVAYKIPAPGYQHKGCGPAEDGVEPDDVLRGFWAACIENEAWRRILDAICAGLGQRVVQQEAIGLAPDCPAGGELRGLVHHAQRLGVLPVLMRATEIRLERDADRFISSWGAHEAMSEFKNLSEAIVRPRELDEDREVRKALRKHGVSLIVPKDEEERMVARQTFRRILTATRGFG